MGGPPAAGRIAVGTFLESRRQVNMAESLVDIQVEDLKRVELVRVSGRIDSSNAAEFDRVLKEVADGARHIVLDLSDVPYISSAGLRAIHSAYMRLKQCGGTMKLSALGPEIRKVFDIAGFNRLFSISPSIEEALGTGQGR